MNSAAQTIGKIVDLVSDREWRIDNLYHVQDAQGRVVRFVRNDSQRELWHGMWWLNLILKDRQRGFSTLIAMFILDSCMFSANTQAGIVDVSLPDAKKKLQKIKFAYSMLPEYLQEANPLTSDNKEYLQWHNGSRVDVSTSHRGGTLQILHVSEFGKISARRPDVAKEIISGAMNTLTTECFIFVESTAEGRGGKFYEMCKHAENLMLSGSVLTTLDFKFFFFGWWMGRRNELDHIGVVIPQETEKYLDAIEAKLNVKLTNRQRCWYHKKMVQQGDLMKREFPSTPDEAFESAIDGAYYGIAMSRARKEKRITAVPYDEGFPVYTWWDLGMDDSTTIIFRQIIGMQNRIIDYVEDSGEGLAWYVKQLKERPYLYERHDLPHDVKVRELGTGIKRQDKLIELGLVNINVVHRPRDIDAVLDGIEACRTLLSTCWIDESKCAKLIDCLENYTKEWDEKAGAFRRSPLHNWASHGADALRTGAVAAKSESFFKSSGIDRNARRDWFC